MGRTSRDFSGKRVMFSPESGFPPLFCPFKDPLVIGIVTINCHGAGCCVILHEDKIIMRFEVNWSSVWWPSWS